MATAQTRSSRGVHHRDDLPPRLERKGYVESDKSDVAYVYNARVSRERVTAAKLRDVMKQLYDGSAAPMVLQLMQNEQFTSDEIAEFQRLLDAFDSDEDVRGGKPGRG